jgi:hypothetical protein
MNRLVDELKHAFAVGPDPERDPRALPPALERLARTVVERGMETPAIIFLDSLTPLSFLASQTMHAFWPLLELVGRADDLPAVAEALEDRRTLRCFAERIEDLAGQRGSAP